MADYALAEHLHMSVAEVGAMSNEEFTGWDDYLAVKQMWGQVRGR